MKYANNYFSYATDRTYDLSHAKLTLKWGLSRGFEEQGNISLSHDGKPSKLQ